MISKPNLHSAILTFAGILTGSLVISAALSLPAPPTTKSTPGKSTGKSVSQASGAGSQILAQGKKIYVAQGCATCHIIAGAGGASGPDLTTTGAQSGHTVQWFSVQIANPKAHNAGSTMPGFAQTIKGQDLTAISTYLVSLKGQTTSGSAGGSASHHTVTKVEAAALAKIEKTGALVSPLSQVDDNLEVSFHMQGASATDKEVSDVGEVKNIVHLDLGQTGVTDAGLAHVKSLTELTELHLEGTKITDAGLVYVKDLHNLTYLNLYGTNITDAGLEHLTHLTNLRHLYVWQTKVTPAGVDKLQKALPKCEIVTGIDLAPKK